MKKLRRFTKQLSFWIFIALFTSCSEDVGYFTINDFYKIEKVDAHVHLNNIDPAIIELAIEDNFKLLTVNVDYPDFPSIKEQYKVASELKKRYPYQIAYASTFSMQGWESQDWKDNILENLQKTFDQGAVAVKIWKNIGMVIRDEKDNLLMINDSIFDDIFKFIAQNNITVIGHQGEPKNCWLPLEKMTVKYEREYFETHPQYHMYVHPEFPRYEEQIQVRNQMLHKNVNLRFIGAHLASLEWSVDEIAKFLDTFPNAGVDMAARMNHLMYQTRQNRKRVREFFLTCQDRIVYATDLVLEAEPNTENDKHEFHKRWFKDWIFLNTDSLMTVPDFEGSFRGLALPKDVVRKIYRKNAQKFFLLKW
jgi:hypothetical protein